MDLVGEDEMKDRAGRNQPRERSQSMRNRKKKEEGTTSEIEAQAGERIGVLGSAARCGEVESRDIALTRPADGLEPRSTSNYIRAERGDSFLAC